MGKKRQSHALNAGRLPKGFSALVEQRMTSYGIFSTLFAGRRFRKQRLTVCTLLQMDFSTEGM